VTTDVRRGWIENCIGSLYHQPTKKEQMTELLKAMHEMMETQTGSLASMDSHQARIEANQ
jgi:hypothetical protein